MSFLDLVDIFSNLSTLGNKESKTKRPKIYMLFFILLIPSLFWFLIELNSIWELTSPILFILIFSGVGLILGIGTIILIYRLGLIEELTKKDVFIILIPIGLLTISFASFANRTCGIMFQD